MKRIIELKTIFNKKTMIAVLTGIALLAVLSMAACTTAAKTGWVNDDGKWYYYDDQGVMLKNTTVDGNILGADGAMVSEATSSTAASPTDGWYLKDGKWYYLVDNSYVKGWIKTSEGKWFYFDEQGVMVNNTTLNIDGKDYVFTSDGACTNIGTNIE